MSLDLEIDKLTRSLEDAATGKVFITEVLPLEKADLKDINTINKSLFSGFFHK
jgi:hypothetical protein